MPEPRLLIDQDLHADAEIALDEAQARHVGTVLRLDVGGHLRPFNARDGEWRARVTVREKRGMRVVLEAQLREAMPSPDLDLLFAPVKRHATDLIVEKATELGVPVVTLSQKSGLTQIGDSVFQNALTSRAILPTVVP